mmetsp:Transcript_5721/g.8719  ORF Transcript_5721/g.8719 Transcript_5721/m.8719 type:complete len:97 (-) Transcript_5721:85-375(-)
MNVFCVEIILIGYQCSMSSMRRYGRRWGVHHCGGSAKLVHFSQEETLRVFVKNAMKKEVRNTVDNVYRAYSDWIMFLLQSRASTNEEKIRGPPRKC